MEGKKTWQTIDRRTKIVVKEKQRKEELRIKLGTTISRRSSPILDHCQSLALDHSRGRTCQIRAIRRSMGRIVVHALVKRDRVETPQSDGLTHERAHGAIALKRNAARGWHFSGRAPRAIAFSGRVVINQATKHGITRVSRHEGTMEERSSSRWLARYRERKSVRTWPKTMIGDACIVRWSEEGFKRTIVSRISGQMAPRPKQRPSSWLHSACGRLSGNWITLR